MNKPTREARKKELAGMTFVALVKILGGHRLEMPLDYGKPGPEPVIKAILDHEYGHSTPR